MMQTATGLIWQAAESPAMEGHVNGVCRACGADGQGLAFGAWVRDTFNDHDKLRPGSIVCHACQFCFTDQNAELAKIVGKGQPQRMRNYSHFVLRGQWIPLSKGDKRRMRAILLDSPDVAVIADSGQKHVAFRALPGWWQFEEARVRPFPARLIELLDLIEPAYQAGISKGEMESGRYSHNRILGFGLESWRGLEGVIRPARGTVALQLALFLAQREEQSGAR